MRCIREYRRETILTPLFVGGEVVMEVVIPFLMALLIDRGINAGDMAVILRLGAALVGLTVVSLAFGALSGRYAALASAGFGRNVRRDMYYNVQGFSFSNIDKFSTASVITRLTTDVTNVQMAFQMIIRVAVRSPLMLLFSLVMAFAISPRLSLIYLGVLPLLGAGLYLVIVRAHPIFERVMRTYDRLNNVVEENLRGIRVVKSFVREDHEKEKFGAISRDIYGDLTRAEKILAFNSPLMQFCIYLCMLGISWFGAHLIVSSIMTTGQLVSLVSYTMQMLISLMMLSMVFVMITIARTSAERIVAILDERSDIHSGPRPVRHVADGSISFRDVDFGYGRGRNLCLRGVNLDIRSGETVGIVGGTGSSKTTLVQLVPRLYDVSAGSLLVGGVDVREYDLETLRNQVAMVLQQNVLFSGSIRENLRWGSANASDDEIARACRLAQAEEFIASFPDGYETRIEQGGVNVSGGQKQRLCIARALLKKPKILILDDSTSAVDMKTDARLRQAFEEEIPDTTKIIIAERVSSVEKADRIVVMDGGRIDAVGTHGELLRSNAIYQEVYNSQTRGGVAPKAAAAGGAG